MIVYAVALTYKDAVPGLQAFSAAQWKALGDDPVKWWQERIDGYDSVEEVSRSGSLLHRCVFLNVKFLPPRRLHYF